MNNNINPLNIYQIPNLNTQPSLPTHALQTHTGVTSVPSVPSVSSIPTVNIPGGSDFLVVFGQSIPKTYIYIIGVVLIVIVGYLLYNWYNKNKDEDDDEPNLQQQMQYMPSQQLQQQMMYDYHMNNQPFEDIEEPLNNQQFNAKLDQAADEVE